MHRISDPVHFRRSVGGLSLIIAPLLLLAGAIVGPESSGETAARLRFYAESPEAAGVSTVLWFLGFVVLTVAVTTLIHLVRDRAVVLGHVGGTLAFAGSIAAAALVVTGIYDIALARELPLEQGVAVTEAIEDDPARFWVLIPALLGTSIGLVLLAAALWRGGVLPVWVFPLLLVGFVVIFLGGEERPVGVIGTALIAVGLAFAGWRVLSMSDDEWLRPPRASAQGHLRRGEREADPTPARARTRERSDGEVGRRPRTSR